jgi:hypothetical protein
VCQTRNPGAATVIRLYGLNILLRITDSPVHAVECRHHYCREWIGKEATGDDTLLGLVREEREKGEQRSESPSRR